MAELESDFPPFDYDALRKYEELVPRSVLETDPEKWEPYIVETKDGRFKVCVINEESQILLMHKLAKVLNNAQEIIKLQFNNAIANGYCTYHVLVVFR